MGCIPLLPNPVLLKTTQSREYVRTGRSQASSPLPVPQVSCFPQQPLGPIRAACRVPVSASYLRSLFLEAPSFQAVRKAMDAGGTSR
jgi:hypothetical protein